jgi:hypothetical protein
MRAIGEIMRSKLLMLTVAAGIISGCAVIDDMTPSVSCTYASSFFGLAAMDEYKRRKGD